MTKRDDQTLAFYADNAASYTAHRAYGHSRHLSAFLDQLPPKAKILELGCGGGRDALAMLNAGFDVTPTDGSPQMAAQAQALLNMPVATLRFEYLDAIDQFDAVWANASLLHVPRAGLPSIIALIYRALKPGGLHLATFKVGDQEGRDQLGRHFNYLSSSQIKQIYQTAAPWQIENLLDYDGTGYGAGNNVPWVAITVRKPH